MKTSVFLLCSFFAGMLLLAVSVQAATPGSAPAAIIVVDTTDPAANPGDGDCSLIEAIDNANGDNDTSSGDCPPGSGPDTIELAVGATYTLTAVHNTTNGENGLPVITSTVTISGQGSTIARSTAGGTPAFRILHVSAGGDLTLNDLTLRYALSNGWSGGAIRNQGGAVTLVNSTLRDNQVIGASGGGIYNRAEGSSATTQVVNSQIVSNTVEVSGGGVFNVANSNVTATMTISNSLVSFNQADESAGGIRSTRVSGSVNYGIFVNVLNSEVSGNVTVNSLGLVGGGGIVNNYTLMTITDSLVSDNRADTGSAFGGGIINTFGDMMITGSTIRDNVAASVSGPFPAGGGGIVNSDGTLTISNSTIAGNQATGGSSGGAVLAVNFFGDSPSVTTIVNSTMSENSADVSAGAVSTLDFAGGQPVTVNFANTIVTDNSAPDVTNCLAATGTTLSSAGHNLENLDTCNFNQGGDLVNTDPLLGPLGDNGGPTDTYTLLDYSPAIDAGDDAICAAPLVNGVDQRGVARPIGPHCDIGSFESAAQPRYLVYLPVILKP